MRAVAGGWRRELEGAKEDEEAGEGCCLDSLLACKVSILQAFVGDMRRFTKPPWSLFSQLAKGGTLSVTAASPLRRPLTQPSMFAGLQLWKTQSICNLFQLLFEILAVEFFVRQKLWKQSYQFNRGWILTVSPLHDLKILLEYYYSYACGPSVKHQARFTLCKWRLHLAEWVLHLENHGQTKKAAADFCHILQMVSA